MTIEERLEVLEKKLLREKWYNRCLILAFAAVVILAGNLGARPAPGITPEIRASKLVLVDENGCERAVLVATRGTTNLTLNDRTGRPLVSLGTDENAPRLSLCDEDGNLVATMTVDKDGTPGMSLYDKHGKVLWQAPESK